MSVILAIDDDPEILTALRRALTSTGHQILLTDDPDQVFEVLAQRPVDLLISDIDMPTMSGIEVVKRVRARHPDVVRMLLTGQTSFDVAQKAINQGEVHRYLCKPFDPVELRGIVAEGLARRADLARQSRAGLSAQRRQALSEQLEHEHPGITTLVRDPDGCYVVSGTRAACAERVLRGRKRGQTNPV